jgi:hypothetical protein
MKEDNAMENTTVDMDFLDFAEAEIGVPVEIAAPETADEQPAAPASEPVTATETAPAPVSTPRIEQPPLPDINETSVCLTVTLKGIGNTRKIPKSKVSVDAEESMYNATKKLYECQELKDITSLDAEIHVYLYRKALPSMFKEGIYRIGIKSIEKIDTALNVFLERRKVLVEKFVANYNAAVSQAREKLRSNFDQKDYPGAETVRAAFVMKWSYITFSTPGVLETINKQIWADERAKAKLEVQQAANEMRDVLRANMLDLVKHMSDKLTGTGKDGKAPIFRDSMVKKMREYLEDFDERNITQDTQLSDLVTQARSLLNNNVDADALRGNAKVREEVGEGMTRIKLALDGMLQEAPIRSFMLDEEE